VRSTSRFRAAPAKVDADVSVGNFNVFNLALAESRSSRNFTGEHVQGCLEAARQHCGAILVVSVRTGDRSLLHNLNLDPKRQVLLRPSLTPL